LGLLRLTFDVCVTAVADQAARDDNDCRSPRGNWPTLPNWLSDRGAQETRCRPIRPASRWRSADLREIFGLDRLLRKAGRIERQSPL